MQEGWETQMQIFVNVLEGKTLRFDVEAYYTINNVKALVRCKENIPTSQQRLIFEDNELENEHDTLSSYKICDGA